MKRIFFVCILFGLLLFPGRGVAAETWAIYWYLCGSDLETRLGSASTDFAELLNAQLPDNVVVVIQTGGSKEWQVEEVSSRHVGRFVYQNGELKKIADLPQANMGDGNTLASFLAFCKKNYAADRQVFVFWDHGGGSVGGVANDENFNNDALSLQEIRRAFERVYKASATRPPFEIIGFDACLMATLDTAVALNGLARYMVASQELEPSNGWEYTKWVGALGSNPSMSTERLGKIICDTYLEGCRKEGTEASATLSLIDLSRIAYLNMTYNALGLEAVSRVVDDESFYAMLGRQAKSAENYMNSRSEGFTNMVDMGSFVRNLKGDLPEFSQITLDALKEAVVYQVRGPYRKPSGLSCYYPFDGSRNSYRTMMKTGNITSFLILNGLQFGFIDTDKAVSHLERISSEISAAVEKEESGGSSGSVSPSGSGNAGSSLAAGIGSGAGAVQGTPAPSPEKPDTPGYDPSVLNGIFNAYLKPESPPDNASSNMASIMGQATGHVLASIGSSPLSSSAGVAAIMGQAANHVLASVHPLQKLDISSLEDFKVEITDTGDARLDLGLERVRFLDNVRFHLAYYSEEDDVILMLGKDADMEADWERGVFKDNFRGVWAALDGHYVYLEITSQDENIYRYAVPIMLNGKRCNLIVVYDLKKGAYRILGARRVHDANMADKDLIRLKAGDKVSTILKVSSISGDDDFQDVEVDTFTLGRKIVFEDIDMGDGTFMFMFEMTDVQNNSATSEVVSFEVKDGEIFLSEVE